MSVAVAYFLGLSFLAVIAVAGVLNEKMSAIETQQRPFDASGEGGGEDQSERDSESDPRIKRINARQYKKGQRKAEKEHKTAADNAANRLVIVTGIIALFTFVSVGVGIRQWQAISGQLDEMQAEQRPAIWVGDIWGQPVLINNQIVWTVQFMNRGKGFVKGGRYWTYIKILNGKFVQSYGQSVDGSIVTPLGPNQTLITTIIGAPDATTMKFEDIIKQPDSVSVRLKYRYSDLGGGNYESQFCLRRLNMGGIAVCEDPAECYLK